MGGRVLTLLASETRWLLTSICAGSWRIAAVISFPEDGAANHRIFSPKRLATPSKMAHVFPAWSTQQTYTGRVCP
jgi:hypothetical protein